MPVAFKRNLGAIRVLRINICRSPNVIPKSQHYFVFDLFTDEMTTVRFLFVENMQEFSHSSFLGTKGEKERERCVSSLGPCDIRSHNRSHLMSRPMSQAQEECHIHNVTVAASRL